MHAFKFSFKKINALYFPVKYVYICIGLYVLIVIIESLLNFFLYIRTHTSYNMCVLRCV